MDDGASGLVKWSKVLDKLGLIFITSILGYGVDQVKDLTSMVDRMNTSVAVILVRFDSQAKEIGDLKERVQFIERRMQLGSSR